MKRLKQRIFWWWAWAFRPCYARDLTLFTAHCRGEKFIDLTGL